MNRREMFAAVPAIGCMGFVAAPAEASPLPSPVEVIFEQWRQYNAWLNGPATREMDEDEFEAACDVRCNLEDQMIATPARDAKDVLMMLIAYSEFGISDMPCKNHLPKFWEQVSAVLGEGGAA